MGSFKLGLLVINGILVGGLVILGMVWGISKLSPETLTNKQIIDQVNYCKKHSLKAEKFVIPLTGETSKIECGVPQ